MLEHMRKSRIFFRTHGVRKTLNMLWLSEETQENTWGTPTQHQPSLWNTSTFHVAIRSLLILIDHSFPPRFPRVAPLSWVSMSSKCVSSLCSTPSTSVVFPTKRFTAVFLAVHLGSPNRKTRKRMRVLHSLLTPG